MLQSVSNEYVVTLVAGQGTSLSPNVVRQVAHSLNAVRVAWLAEGEAADIFCAVMPEVKPNLGNLPIDYIVQPSSTRRKKFLLADMESTVIEQEMLDELADVLGIRAKVAEITRRAMNGELNFADALRERVSLLKGQPASLLDNVAARISSMPGASTLLATMKANGATCWLASGGFGVFARGVAQQLGFDAFFANELIVRDGVITGDIAAPIFDKEGKKNLLKQAEETLGLSCADVAAIGDGANDIPMLLAANEGKGLGIAYRAKPHVRSIISPQINHGGLTALLYAQGYRKNEFQ